MKMRILGAIMALSLVAVLAGCGSADSGGGKDVVVKLQNVAFNPKSLEVKAGTTVKWINEDVVDHSVVEGTGESDSPKFRSADLSSKGEYSHTFTEPGTYDVVCTTGSHHLIGMTMKVVVK